MFLDQLSTAGAIPTLALTLRFAGERQRLIAHNVANLETPNFRPSDVSPRAFQSVLQDAVRERRRATGGGHGDLRWRGTRELIPTQGGAGVRLEPRTPTGNILFHDRNNRDLERTMQSMVENAGAYRVASELLRSRMDLLGSAIRERVA